VTAEVKKHTASELIYLKHMENQNNVYQCPVCKLNYPTEELANKCETWCTENHSCNLDITQYAIKENAE
jgi:hypothetical protein